MDPDELLTRRVRQALAAAMEPLTLSSASRERIRGTLRGAAPMDAPVDVPSRPERPPALPTRWRRGPRAWVGSPAAVLRPPVWGAAGAALLAAAILAAVLVPRGGPPPSPAASAAPPRALAQSPRRPASHPTPVSAAAVAPAPGGAAKARDACPGGPPRADLVAPVRVTVTAGRATTIALAATGGCAAGRVPTATLEGPGLTPGRLAVDPAPALHRALGLTASPSRSSRFVIRWTGRLRSGRALPAGTYRVLVRLPGTLAAATVLVRVGGTA